MMITPSLDHEPLEVHPAIGLVGDTAYVGVWLPCDVSELKENKRTGKTTIHRTIKDLLFLITDNRKSILANDEIFMEKGWRLACKPIHYKNRWPMADVKAWLDGTFQVPEPRIVFDNVLSAWKKYMEFSDPKEYEFKTLWDIATYFHILFLTFGYDYFGGVKRSGKTKGLMVHKGLAFNAILSNNMSTASIYRLVQNARCTLLIDESEKLSNPERAQEFRSILLAGYKAGEVVYRVDKNQREKLVPEAFEVYSPKALANISGLEDVLEDRIPHSTYMQRGLDHKVVNAEVDENDPEWPRIRSLLYTLFLSYWREVLAIYQGLHGESSELNEQVNLTNETIITARERELWLPILSLAKFFDTYGATTKFTSSLDSQSSPLTLFNSMLSLARDSARDRQVEDLTETGDMILVHILLEKVKADAFYPVKLLKESLAEHFDEELKWLNTRWVGRALRRLGFKEKRRLGTGYEYRLTPTDVGNLAKRMQIEKTPGGEKPDKKSQPTLPEFSRAQCELCGEWSDSCSKVEIAGVTVVVCPKCKELAETPPNTPPTEAGAMCWVCNQPIREGDRWTLYKGRKVHLPDCYHKASEEATP
jgi:hypothetical protein